VLRVRLATGKYQLALGPFDRTSAVERTLEFALKVDLREAAGYYRLATLKLTAP
jgi:hypothetical protein